LLYGVALRFKLVHRHHGANGYRGNQKKQSLSVIDLIGVE
jgi:hypothetical protein